MSDFLDNCFILDVVNDNFIIAQGINFLEP